MTPAAGRRALVTGGVSGIGLACVRQIGMRGGTVAVNHLPGDDGAGEVLATLRAEGIDAIAAPGDVSDAADATAMTRRAITALGGLDYLVNSAGTSAVSRPIAVDDLAAVTDEVWQRTLATNLLGPDRVVRAAAQALTEAGGAVVNVASAAGIRVPGSSPAYAAGKAGLIRLTVDLARGLAPVRVNAVAPALVLTPWTSGWNPDVKARMVDQTPLRRACEADDVADVVLFLLEGAKMVTGQTIVVDGGFSL